MSTRLCFSLVTLLAAFTCRAEVKLPAFFSDHMVLQQKVKIPVWGWAAPGEKISVSLGSDHAQATADAAAKWRVDLAPLKASSTPQQLEVAGQNKITISDVLVGEVWICSGQSNMERQLGARPGQPPIQDWEKERDAANYPLIRHFGGAQTRANAPASNLAGRWAVCSPAKVSDFTAVGYFFARDLYLSLKVPIGLIHVSVGGTPIEAWTNTETQASDPEFRLALTRFGQSVRDFPEQLEQYKKAEPELLKKHEADVAKALAEGKPAPGLPSPPRDPRLGTPPASLYNGMIAPLIP
ncbi:MAG TPA: sialate O-acetylesterase, partial [Chthoniobacterales bacterium]|nr:sialate O-acetylesterase [Chthoniobacterales bacterium]